MSIKLTWLGHGSWSIETGGVRLLLDPFLDDSPTAPVKSGDVSADVILVSHGHFDHVADVASIAKRTGATIAANYEICEWFGKQGCEKSEPMNLGGGVDLPCGRLVMTIAHHSSTLPDGAAGGSPGGFVLAAASATIYFACDTAVFSDMKLIGSGVYADRAGIDLAVLPIGDRFTMGPADSIQAIHLIQPKQVAPAHYNTWPPIAQDVGAWAELVRRKTTAEPLTPAPGDSFTVGAD